MTITRTRRPLWFVVGAPVVLAALAGCTSASNAGGLGPNAAGTTTVPAAVTTSTAASTTATPTTEAATTTTEPATTTTPAPTTTSTTLPPNVVKVPVSKVVLKAVGGASGPDTAAVQARLLQLGFWLGDAKGSYGWTTNQAVMAFQKYLGLPRTGLVDPTTAAFLQNLTEKPHGTANSSDLIEVDKTKQLLFIIRGGKTVWTFNTSTGSGKAYTAVNAKDPTKIEKGDAQTPVGLFKTNREHANGWWEGDLGQIYRPKYFVGGIAIHGMTVVPAYPASHGCVRVSLPAMDFIWAANLDPLKTVVWVHV